MGLSEPKEIMQGKCQYALAMWIGLVAPEYTCSIDDNQRCQYHGDRRSCKLYGQWKNNLKSVKEL
jgi:hypothetical protein